MKTTDQSTCDDCSQFIPCFNASNSMIGIKPEDIDESMLSEAARIPACPAFTRKQP